MPAYGRNTDALCSKPAVLSLTRCGHGLIPQRMIGCKSILLVANLSSGIGYPNARSRLVSDRSGKESDPGSATY
jgi:hypothetical protein